MLTRSVDRCSVTIRRWHIYILSSVYRHNAQNDCPPPSFPATLVNREPRAGNITGCLRLREPKKPPTPNFYPKARGSAARALVYKLDGLLGISQFDRN
ncbi:hypothetical protein IF1G_09983 [Cordyceps javanica]|uniref:Uncharacterized protein n=1 Tax=Cordyceps javanica TaxID=43265 RepID=A0A545UPU1_9HYPO|nr:hypothetical protein IF1G_09983 [Cordyceps javanica]